MKPTDEEIRAFLRQANIVVATYLKMLGTPENTSLAVIRDQAGELWESYRSARQSDVDESMDNAITNGYNFIGWNTKEIAGDMIDYDKTFNGADVEELLPFIRDWLSRNPQTPRHK